MTENELCDYVKSHGCFLYQNTKKYYKFRKNGTTGTLCMSGIEKIDENRQLDNTYVFNVCKSLCIDPPINDVYSVNIFQRFWDFWKKQR